MEPIGNITNYFPFIDEQSLEILTTIMNESKDYGDFLLRLCERVCSEDAPRDARYLFLRMSMFVWEVQLVRRFAETQSVSDLERPLVFLMKGYQGEKIEWQEMQEALKTALETVEDDWLLYDLLLTYSNFRGAVYPKERDLSISQIESINEHLFSSPELRFLVPTILRWQFFFRDEGNPEEAETRLKRGLQIAKEVDDRVETVNILNSLANLTKFRDCEKATDLCIAAQEIAESTGFRWGVGNAHHNLGHIASLRGEYEKSIMHHTRDLEIIKSMDGTDDIISNVISFVNSMASNGEQALEWSTRVVEHSDRVKTREGLIQAFYAWALITCGRLIEVEEILEDSRVQLMRSGKEKYLGIYYMVQGIAERANEDYDSAAFSMESALEIFERVKHPLWINHGLLVRAELEVDCFKADPSGSGLEYSGPWLEALVDRMNSNDYPGYAAQTQLLVARLRFMQGREEEATRIIREVKRISEEQGMPYLMKKALLVLEKT
jgi:tetratricopeptide (TPR) repeat protein